MRWMALLWVGSGCSGPDDGGSTSEDTGPSPVLDTDGACGAVSSTDVTITGAVEDGAGLPIADADLELEERNFRPGTVHGTARTDGSGRFLLQATDLPVVEGCWGTAVSFWLVGETNGLTGEKPMNPGIMEAYEDGTLAYDLGAFPLILR